jgi:ABC-2 type transport system ATP-binding protein
MKQRLALARAIMHGPELLFLDEPTSGLDPATATYIHQLILEERAKGTAIFLTTHNMEEATKLCDNVALLNKGEIVEYGCPMEICRKHNNQNKIQILLKSGETFLLQNDASSAEMISNYFKENAVESIHSSEPNLETVFMELTGRKFE